MNRDTLGLLDTHSRGLSLFGKVGDYELLQQYEQDKLVYLPHNLRETSDGE